MTYVSCSECRRVWTLREMEVYKKCDCGTSFRKERRNDEPRNCFQPAAG